MSGLCEQIQYGSKNCLNPTLDFTKILPLQNTSSSTVSSNSGSQITFQLPARTVYNLRNSIFRCTLTPGAPGAGVFNWIYARSVGFIQNITIMTASSMKRIMDKDFMYRCIDMELPLKTSFQNLITNDVPATSSDTWGGLYTTMLTGDRADNTTKFKVSEADYFIVGGDNTATPVVNYQFPLSVFGDICDDPRLLAFNEQLFITITLAPIGVLGFEAASASDPSSSPGPLTASAALSNIELHLAYCMDASISNMILEQINREEGIQMYFDYSYVSRTSLAISSSQAINFSLLNGNGKRIKKVQLALYNTTESSNTVFNRSNIAANSYSRLQTSIDTRQLQNFPMVCGAAELNDDYKNLRPLLKNHSCIQSQDEFQYNSFWLDVFYDINNKDPRMYAGLPVEASIQYQALFTSASTAKVAYVISTYQRTLKINRNGVFIDSE